MDEKSFLEMVLQERIAMLLKTGNSDRVDAIWNAAEQVFSQMQGEDREKVEMWRDMIIDLEEKNQKNVYLGGLKDGIHLAFYIMMTGMDGVYLTEQVLE